MPFGVVLGAIYFAAVAVWAASGLPPAPWGPVRLVGLCVGCIAVALAAGLALRQSWARWAGVVFALLLAVAGSLLVAGREQATDYAVVLGALTTLVLLLVAPTGDPTRGFEAGRRPWRRTGRVLGWVTLAALAMLVAAGVPTFRRQPIAPPADGERHDDAVQAAPVASRLTWLDFGSGLDRAKMTGKPMFIDFYATWCGPCKMMEQTTFRDAGVARKLSEIVAVRVDSEDTEPRSGYRGAEVAERFRVTAYPTLVVVSSDGHEIGRRTGYLSPDEFAAWLGRSVERAQALRTSPPRTRA